MLRVVIILVSFLLCTNFASAIPIQLDFTATNFDGDWYPPYDPPPQDVVEGTFIWEADSIHDPIQEILFVSLNIAGHEYTLRELGVFSPDGQGTDIIGASNYRSIGAGTDDFILQWYKDPTETVRFVYASSVYRNGIWASDTFSKFSYTVSGPPTLWISLIGLFATVVLRSRLDAGRLVRVFSVART